MVYTRTSAPSPPSKRECEALAQRYALYSKTCNEDSLVNKYRDPVGRKRATEELYASGRAQPDVGPLQLVGGPGGDPDKYLALVDADIERLGAKGAAMTTADRVFRWHIALSAIMVFVEYKLVAPYGGFDGVVAKITTRGHKISDEWLKANYERIKSGDWPPAPNERAVPPPSVNLPTTPSPPRQLHTPPSSSPPQPMADPCPLTPKEVKDLVKRPSPLIDMRFECHDETAGGVWKLQSFTQSSGRQTEFWIKYDDCNGLIPMDKDAMTWLLGASLVVEGLDEYRYDD
ncbi:uncharacterized protein BXZ73DRAFT_79718 [Epithele typhae]|uniref:uncharacterized protein n=1 Tax=Epithele typhae TaxID=378194 RepID=UPI00200838FC|nr:uncharacterized protein BXZ73DRAFT_79718 [Epithele typhae]KAH9922320.1 hypothetical protein BXZ73DRAFT_79718 [Epithele typhae]